MMLKARPFIHYAPLPGGVYFGGPRTQFVIRGSDVLFTVADTCVPLLELGTTEEEMVLALGSERARLAVRLLIAGLRRNDMLLDLDRLSVPEPPQHVRDRHPESLAYLESACDDPYAVFARLYAAKVVLDGPPEAVSPAMRGLIRAGVGKVVLPLSGGGSCQDADAALVCLDAGHPDPAGPLPDRIPVVPVQFAGPVILVGPAASAGSGHRTWQALRDRATAWARAEHAELADGPAAATLAGALAGQLVFETLAGLTAGGEASLVHGADLVTERLIVEAGHAGQDEAHWHLLEQAADEAAPATEDALGQVAVLTRRWTGLFSAQAEENLPQMPCALREFRHRAAATAGPVIGWAPEQPSATIGVALEALRRSGPDGEPVAAGLTEERWLLDGALRQLRHEARFLGPVTLGDLDREAARTAQALDETGADPVALSVLAVPGLDWRLGRVASAVTGRTLGLAWAPGPAAAVAGALGTALARARAAALREDENAVGLLYTDLLVSAAGPVITALREQVSALAAARGTSYRGRARRDDPVLGVIPFWYGPVEARLLIPEPRHAEHI